MTRERLEVSTERTVQGAWRCTTVYAGQYWTHQYFFYTKREAVALFRAMLREEGR